MDSTLASPIALLFEFTPFGPGELWADGRLAIAVGGIRQAVRGEGAVDRLELEAGTHSLVVRSCPAQ